MSELSSHPEVPAALASLIASAHFLSYGVTLGVALAAPWARLAVVHGHVNLPRDTSCAMTQFGHVGHHLQLGCERYATAGVGTHRRG